MPPFIRTLPLVLAIAACGSEPTLADPLPPSAPPSAPRSAPAELPPAAPSFAMLEIVLYQHENVAAQRTGDVEELAAFLKAVERAVAAAIPVGSTPRELDVVIAIKPGRRARFWFVQDPDGETIPPQLDHDLQALEAPQVTNGPIALALIGSVAGAPKTSKRGVLPMPRQWLDALEKDGPTGPLPEAILAVLWPE